MHVTHVTVDKDVGQWLGPDAQTLFIHLHLTLSRGWGRGQTIRRDNILCCDGEGQGLWAPQKGCVIPSHRGSTPRASATAGLCVNEEAPPLESHSPPHPARVQRADPGLDFKRLLVSEAQPTQPSLDSEV